MMWRAWVSSFKQEINAAKKTVLVGFIDVKDDGLTADGEHEQLHAFLVNNVLVSIRLP